MSIETKKDVLIIRNGFPCDVGNYSDAKETYKHFIFIDQSGTTSKAKRKFIKQMEDLFSRSKKVLIVSENSGITFHKLE